MNGLLIFIVFSGLAVFSAIWSGITGLGWLVFVIGVIIAGVVGIENSTKKDIKENEKKKAEFNNMTINEMKALYHICSDCGDIVNAHLSIAAAYYIQDNVNNNVTKHKASCMHSPIPILSPKGKNLFAEYWKTEEEFKLKAKALY